MTRRISQPWADFWRAGLSFVDYSGWISKPDTIYQNSWTQTFYRYNRIHLIALDIDWTHWSWNIFTLQKICSMLIEQLIFLRNVTENLKCNWELHLLLIWLKTLVVIDLDSCRTSFPSFCVPPSEVAVLFYLNLSGRPFLGQVVDLDLLLCAEFDSENVDLFLCHISTQRPTAGSDPKRLSEVMGAALVGNNFSPISSKISFHVKKKWIVAARNLPSIKTFLTL